MSKNNLINNLINFGLDKKEAKIYLSLLKSQKMSISEISRTTGLKRSTCYQYIDSLLLQNFLIRIPLGKRMFYAAVNPQKILKEKKKQFNNFEKSIQEMSNQYEETIKKPKIVFYEGKRGIKNIYEEIFTAVGDIYSIFPPQTFMKNFTTQDYDNFDKAINNFKLKSKDLIIEDEYFKIIEKIRKKNGLENKFTKKLSATFKSNVDVLIYNDKVALISLKDLSALVIQNKDIMELFKSIHNFIWKSV